MTFSEEIRLGIPDFLPEPMPYDPNINHAPKRKEILNHEEKQLALRNALRYFPKQLHAQLAPEFIAELDTYDASICTAIALHTICTLAPSTSIRTAPSRLPPSCS